MKNLIVLFSLLLGLSFNSNCQSLLVKDRAWTVEIGMTLLLPGCLYYIPPGYYILKVGNKVAFGEKEYCEILQTNDSLSNEWNVVRYLREDEDGKVYFYSKRCEQESLLYDFNLKADTTVFLVDQNYWEFSDCRLCKQDSVMHIMANVTMIDSVSDGYAKRKRLKVGDEYWVEGIGSMSGHLRAGDRWLLGSVSQVKNCYESGKIIFTNEDPQVCFRPYGTGISDWEQDKIGIFIDSDNKTLQIINADGMSADIYTMQGEYLHTFYINSNLHYEDVFGLPKGVYIIQIRDKNVSFNRKVVVS